MKEVYSDDDEDIIYDDYDDQDYRNKQGIRYIPNSQYYNHSYSEDEAQEYDERNRSKIRKNNIKTSRSRGQNIITEEIVYVNPNSTQRTKKGRKSQLASRKVYKTSELKTYLPVTVFPELESSSGTQILQKAKISNICCEFCFPFITFRNKYDILRMDDQKPIFTAEETTGCCCRHLFLASLIISRKIDLRIKSTNFKNRGEGILILKKSWNFKLGIINCFKKPTMMVYLKFRKDRKKIQLGKIINNTSCLLSYFIGYSFSIFDYEETHLYNIEISPCHVWGKKCSDSVLWLKHVDGRVITSLGRTNNLCSFEGFFSDMDNYFFNFPIGICWEQKALIIAAAIFIDFTIFEKICGGV